VILKVKNKGKNSFKAYETKEELDKEL